MHDGQEPIQDIAHLGHVEILTPKPEQSLWYFRDLLGMEPVHESGDSVYLRVSQWQPILTLAGL